MNMTLDETKQVLKNVVYNEIEKEILAEYGMSVFQWQMLLDSYSMIRHQLSIEDSVYFKILNCMYRTRKVIDDMEL